MSERISDTDIADTLDDLKGMWAAAVDLIGALPGAAPFLATRQELPPLIDAVFEQAKSPGSEKQPPITDNDRRWRFLEHGCQWVSFTPIGGDTRSFDPRFVSGYAGHLEDMRATVDREAEKQLAILREGINAAKR